MIKLKIFLSLILLSVGSFSFAFGLSCTQHLNKTEKIICQNKPLLHLDSQLNHKFKELRSNIVELEPLVDEQLFWTSHVRDSCKTQLCIKDAYTVRINSLKDYATKVTPNNSVFGTYTYWHDVEAFNPNADGMITKQVKDIMTLSMEKGSKIKFSVFLNGAMDNTCELHGDAYIKGQEYQITTANKACKLSLSFTHGFVQLHDYQGICRMNACGNRLSLDGKIFLRGTRSFKAR